VYVCERVRMCVRESVCFRSSLLKGDRDREGVCVCAREKKSKKTMCVLVNVCVRECVTPNQRVEGG